MRVTIPGEKGDGGPPMGRGWVGTWTLWSAGRLRIKICRIPREDDRHLPKKVPTDAGSRVRGLRRERYRLSAAMLAAG